VSHQSRIPETFGASNTFLEQHLSGTIIVLKIGKQNIVSLWEQENHRAYTG
jgi:hypothetical protein